MESVRDLWNGLDDVVVTAITIVVVLVAAVVVQRLVIRAMRRAYWTRVDRQEPVLEAARLGRMNRQKTFVTTLESLVRYGVYGAALVVAIGLATGGRATALLGASVVAVVLGFGLQRLLGDVVAGALLLFEGHFGVGDVITVHTQGVTGIVEDFSLRTTVLRTLGGDRIVIMNSGIIAATRWSQGQRRMRLELLVRSADAADVARARLDAEASYEPSPWLRAPRVEEELTTELAGGIVRLVATVVVAPGLEPLVDRLAEVVTAELGEGGLLGPISVLALRPSTFDPWRAGVLLVD
jgi:small-conductance mechanosensitive channel